MKNIDTSQRSEQAEIMDDFQLQGPELEKTLQDLDNINKFLGGNTITINGVKELLKNCTKGSPIVIADIGCGSGTILRKIAEWGRKKGLNLKLLGIDANIHAIELAKQKSTQFPEIDFEALNIFSEEFQKKEFDIILCTLTLHHFKNPEIISLLNSLYKQVRIGIVINDLQRSKKAYYLFQAFCKVFINNEIARLDGLTSILRSFKKKDLRGLSTKIPSTKQEIKWQWAFRYRWLIFKEQF